MKQRILVVDDESDICDILSFNLSSAGYEVQTATSAAAALACTPGSFDLLLLDVMMPGTSGFDLARQLDGIVPIIFLTARDTEADTLRGFELGADDYITKPFSVREVQARVRAVLARTTVNDVVGGIAEPIVCEGLRLDVARKVATIDGEPLPLTKTELELLALLMSQPSTVFSRQELLQQVWPPNVIVTDRTVDVNIARLRKKLGNYAPHLVARQGYGYEFKV